MDLGPDFGSIDVIQGPWDQETFEDLLAKWIIATDQPFHTVDEPEFRKLLAYTHHCSPELMIPHWNAVRRRVMKMGEDSVESTKELFMVGKSQPHITGSLTSHYRWVLKAKSAFHSMHGHRAITMHSWRLWHTTSQQAKSWVWSFIGESPLADHVNRGTSY